MKHPVVTIGKEEAESEIWTPIKGAFQAYFSKPIKPVALVDPPS